MTDTSLLYIVQSFKYHFCVFKIPSKLFSNQHHIQERTDHASFLHIKKNDKEVKSTSVIIGVSVTIIILLAASGTVIYFKVSPECPYVKSTLYCFCLHSITKVSYEVEILKECGCTGAAIMGEKIRRLSTI